MTDLRKLDVLSMLTGIKAPKTAEAYATHWAKYLAFATDRDPADAKTLIAWRQYLIHDTKEAPATINLRLRSVKAVFRELAEQRQVAKEVSWAILEVKTLKPNALPERRRQNFRVRINPQEMRGLIETPHIALGDPYGARSRALLLLLATSGLRISEAIRVRVKDIQKVGDNYLIANILGKGQNQTRLAPLSQEAYLAIQDWLFVRPTQSEWVFSDITWNNNGTLLYSENPITRSTAYHMVKAVAAEYGMPAIKPHDFRRFVGTQLAKTDIRQAQRVLGHKSIETTAKHYILDDVPLGSTEGLF